MDHHGHVEQDKLTSESEQSKLSLTLEAIDSQQPAPAASSTTEVVDSPYTHIERAVALFDPSDPARQNAASAEAEWKKAIDSADKLPLADYRAKLAEVEARIKTESDPVASQELLNLKEGLRELIDLPSSLRIATTTFYLQNSRPDQAKAMLEAALEQSPALKDQERFRQLVEISRENSKDGLERTISFLKATGKDLISDGIAGSVGLAAFSLTPGGRVLKLGSALLAGGATKHGLSMIGLGGEGNSALQNFAWGAVDALAMASGAGVRERMVGNLEKSVTSASAKEILVRGGVNQSEKLALLDGKNGLEALQTASVVLADSTAAKGAAARSALGNAVENLDARAGQYLRSSDGPLRYLNPFNLFGGGESFRPTFKQLQFRSKFWNQYATEEAAARNIWQQSAGKSLRTFMELSQEFRAAKGSWLSYLNPLNMFKSPSAYSGTLRNLEAGIFWNRYKIDALSIGATSLVYRGAHEAVKVGHADPTTGKTSTALDAVRNTAVGTVADGLGGAFLVSAVRGLGFAFTKHAGVAGEVSPLRAPAAPQAIPAESGPLSIIMQPGRYASHYFGRLPAYGLNLAMKNVGEGLTAAGRSLSLSPQLEAALAAIPTSAALFSPQLMTAYESAEMAGQYEKTLAETQKPLEDKSNIQPKEKRDSRH